MLIYFVGYIEAGKKKWGQKLAKEIDYEFLDTRDLMQKKTGKTYEELLNDKNLFISTEQEIIEEISQLKNTIIAVSELLPCRGNNMDILNKSGITFYLRAGVGCIMMKVSLMKNRIPLLKGIHPDIVPDFVIVELKKRQPFYSQAKINYLARELTMKKLFKLLEEVGFTK